MKYRLLGFLLVGTILVSSLGLAGCGSSKSEDTCTKTDALGCVGGPAAFLLIDLVLDPENVFELAKDSVLLASNAIQLITTLHANQSPPENKQPGHIQVSILYNKKGVAAQDVYNIDSGKASLGILFEGGTTFEAISSNRVDIDATQTQRITIVPLQNASTTFTVSAKKGWQNTGVFLEKGKQFRVKYVSGLWTISKGKVGTSDAAGEPLNAPPNLICHCGEPLDGYTTQGLIGQIAEGVGHAPLQVGDDFSGVSYDNDFLYLRMNLADQLLPFSDGTIKVTIETENA